MSFSRSLTAFIVLLLIASFSHAQTNAGQIRGLIKDHAGAIIPNCAVSATNTGTNIHYDLVTDGAGQFQFPSLPVGQYTVRASAAGFQQLIKSGIDLHLGQIIDLNLELVIGELTVIADVTTTDGLLATATGEVSEVIDKKRVAELPLNGRQFLQLALLSEGVVKPPGGTRGSALQQAGELVNVAGQRSGPGTKNFDLAAARVFILSESKRLDFRIETFNLFNTANFDLPNRFAFTPNFGKIFSAGPARQIQLGLKLSF